MSNQTMVDEYGREQRLAVCNTQWRDKKMMRKFDNPLSDCEIKLDSKNTGVFEGYASKFGGVDSYGDTIMKGAYTKTLKSGRNPSMFVNHDSYQVPVGDWVQLGEDDNGLYVKGKIDLKHKDGPTVYSALERKAMDGLSIGYKVPKGGGTENDTGGLDLTEITLKEISVVNFPADDNARINIVKSDIELLKSLRDVELFLRESGYSRSMATAFLGHIKKLAQSESVGDLEDEIKNREILMNEKIHLNTNQFIDLIKKL